MRIWLFCSEYPPAPSGGVGSLTRDLAHQLTEWGHDVFLVGLYAVQTLVRECDGRATVVRVPRSRAGSRVGVLLDRVRLARVVQQLVQNEGVEVVESPAGGGESAFLRKSVPFVARLHSPARAFARSARVRRGRLVEFLEDLSVAEATHIKAVCQWMREHASELHWGARRRRAITVIHNGVDLRLFRPGPWAERKAAWWFVPTPDIGVGKFVDLYTRLAGDAEP